MPKSSGGDAVSLTAGIHRQIWISGMALFVDVQVSNSSAKTVKRLDLEIIRTMMTYSYSSSTNLPDVPSYMTLPQQAERRILARQSIQKSRHGWQGVPPQSRDERTWKMDVPSGLATIVPGKLLNMFDVPISQRFLMFSLPHGLLNHAHMLYSSISPREILWHLYYINYHSQLKSYNYLP